MKRTLVLYHLECSGHFVLYLCSWILAPELERVQRQAARFIKRDYRSREPGCVTKCFKICIYLHYKNEEQQRLTLMYKIVEGQIPALPPDKFLIQVDKNKRQIKQRRFDGYQPAKFVERLLYNNSRGFIVPETSTEQYRRSFFVQTVNEWNKLEEEVVQASSVAAFSAALRRTTAESTD